MTKKINPSLATAIQEQMDSIGVRMTCPLCRSLLQLDDQLTSILTESYFSRDYLALVCGNCYHVQWIASFPYLDGLPAMDNFGLRKSGEAQSDK